MDPKDAELKICVPMNILFTYIDHNEEVTSKTHGETKRYLRKFLSNCIETGNTENSDTQPFGSFFPTPLFFFDATSKTS